MRQLQQQTGFSLLEVVIAISIFAVGMLAVAGLQTTSISGNVFAREATVSAGLGQAEIERLLALSFDHPDLSVTAGNPRSWTEERYLYRLEVMLDDLFPQTKTIQLDVEYSLKGQAKRTRMVAVKADSI
jgi:type IV pilus assembly protein PilV